MYMQFEKSVIQAILNVVTHHECAVIADFGGFIVRRNPGLFNSFSGELKASTAIVYFNNEIKSDDGLVADALRELTGESFKSCQQIISDWVKHIQQEITLKKHYSLLPLGNFHCNSAGAVFFVSSPNLNIDPFSFGLPVFQWKWDLFTESKSIKEETSYDDEVLSPSVDTLPNELIAENPQTLSNTSVDSKGELSDILETSDNSSVNENSDKPSIVWQIAAAIAIVSISISLYFTFSQLLGSRKKSSMDEAAMIISEVAQTTEDIVFVKEDKPRNILPKRRFVSGQEGLDSMKYYLSKNSGNFYVTGGSYITEKLAIQECNRWQKLGYDVCLLKAKKSSLFKVVIARFHSEKTASKFAEHIDEMPAGTISIEELSFNW